MDLHLYTYSHSVLIGTATYISDNFSACMQTIAGMDQGMRLVTSVYTIDTNSYMYCHSTVFV